MLACGALVSSCRARFLTLVARTMRRTRVRCRSRRGGGVSGANSARSGSMRTVAEKMTASVQPKTSSPGSGTVKRSGQLPGPKGEAMRVRCTSARTRGLSRAASMTPRDIHGHRALVGRGYGNESSDVPTGEVSAATTEHGRSARSARSAMERAQPREDDREDIPTHASACGSARLRLMRNRVKANPRRRRRRWDSTSFVVPRKWEPQRRRSRKFLPSVTTSTGVPPRRAVHSPFTLRDGVRVARDRRPIETIAAMRSRRRSLVRILLLVLALGSACSTSAGDESMPTGPLRRPGSVNPEAVRRMHFRRAQPPGCRPADEHDGGWWCEITSDGGIAVRNVERLREVVRSAEKRAAERDEARESDDDSGEAALRRRELSPAAPPSPPSTPPSPSSTPRAPNASAAVHLPAPVRPPARVAGSTRSKPQGLEPARTSSDLRYVCTVTSSARVATSHPPRALRPKVRIQPAWTPRTNRGATSSSRGARTTRRRTPKASPSFGVGSPETLHLRQSRASTRTRHGRGRHGHGKDPRGDRIQGGQGVQGAESRDAPR